MNQPGPEPLLQDVEPSREHTAELTRQAEQLAREEKVRDICPCIAIYTACRCGRRP